MAAFEFLELAEADAEAHALFARAFRREAPYFPRHFVARFGERAVGYVHYSEPTPDVYLCGGLCVDERVYRAMNESERSVVKRHGTLSRWLLEESIRQLVGKHAVFAYTGNAISLRDCLALGFLPTDHKYLIVQWHAQPMEDRAGLVARVARYGPF